MDKQRNCLENADFKKLEISSKKSEQASTIDVCEKIILKLHLKIIKIIIINLN